MSDETNNTMADIMNLLQSPKPPSQPPSQQLSQPARQNSVEEVLAQSSSDAVHAFAESIKQNAMKEASKDEEFKREFKRRLFRALAATYVWSNARLSHEIQSGEGKLAEDVRGLLTLDRDQERLRAQLSELMAAVGRAVAMFGQF